jgi:hypothetical protein
MADPLPKLKISENKRFLVTESGEPFFYLGDTAWELFHRDGGAHLMTFHPRGGEGRPVFP